MNRILTFCFLLISINGFTQNFIGNTKSQVTKKLNDYIRKNDTLNAAINVTDTAIILNVKGSPSLPADFIYKFNKEGKCISEKTIAYCDSCYNKFLKAALNNKKYGWKKINGNQYVSNFASQMLIELPVNETDLSFIILKTAWNREMYKMLKGQ